MPLWLKNLILLVVVWYAGIRVAYWFNEKIKDEANWAIVFSIIGVLVVGISVWIFWPAK